MIGDAYEMIDKINVATHGIARLINPTKDAAVAVSFALITEKALSFVPTNVVPSKIKNVGIKSK